MAQWLWRLSVSRATLVRFQHGAETLCSPLPFSSLRCTEPVSALTQALLYWFALYIFLQVLLWFHQWRSRADRVLTLNTNIRLPLFWSTWSDFHCFGALGVGPGARTPSRPHMRAWRMGVIIVIQVVEPRSKSHKSCLAIVSPWIVENTWKQWTTVRFFQPSLPHNILCNIEIIEYNIVKL